MTRTRTFSSFFLAVGLTVSTIFPLEFVSAGGAPDLACSSPANIAKVTELIQNNLPGGNGGLKLAAALAAIRTTETTGRTGFTNDRLEISLARASNCNRRRTARLMQLARFVAINPQCL